MAGTQHQKHNGFRWQLMDLRKGSKWDTRIFFEFDEAKGKQEFCRYFRWLSNHARMREERCIDMEAKVRKEVTSDEREVLHIIRELHDIFDCFIEKALAGLSVTMVNRTSLAVSPCVFSMNYSSMTFSLTETVEVPAGPPLAEDFAFKRVISVVTGDGVLSASKAPAFPEIAKRCVSIKGDGG
mmetsp:Transcript_44145/g.84768  ORF Transcript_44145/g.84768 Transcript_44145/m.84768 type:complete len:183 (+) Transcript_44145:498-1046(+)